MKLEPMDQCNITLWHVIQSNCFPTVTTFWFLAMLVTWTVPTVLVQNDRSGSLSFPVVVGWHLWNYNYVLWAKCYVLQLCVLQLRLMGATLNHYSLPERNVKAWHKFLVNLTTHASIFFSLSEVGSRWHSSSSWGIQKRSQARWDI